MRPLNDVHSVRWAPFGASFPLTRRVAVRDDTADMTPRIPDRLKKVFSTGWRIAGGVAVISGVIAFVTRITGVWPTIEDAISDLLGYLGDFLTSDVEVWHAFILSGILLLLLVQSGRFMLRQQVALEALRVDLAIAKRESRRQLRRFVGVLSRGSSAPMAMGIALDTGLGLPLDDRAQIAVGESLSIEIVVLPPGAALPWITGCTFVLNFDPNVVQVTAVTPPNGDFLIDDAMSVTDGVPNTSGAFECLISQFVDGSPSPGWGILARITLTGVGAGTTAISLTEARITGPTERDSVAVQQVFGATVVVADSGREDRSRK